MDDIADEAHFLLLVMQKTSAPFVVIQLAPFTCMYIVLLSNRSSVLFHFNQKKVEKKDEMLYEV